MHRTNRHDPCFIACGSARGKLSRLSGGDDILLPLSATKDTYIQFFEHTRLDGTARALSD
jgi:hypothetical protein